MTAYTGQWRIDAKTTSYQTTAVVPASSVAAGDTLDLQLVDPSGLFQINDAASMVVAFPGFTNKGGMQWEAGQGATGSVLARHVTVGDWYRFHMNAVPSSAGGMWWAGNVTLSKTTAPAGPTLNNAAGVYAGSVSAVAVYAGAVKVWPPAPSGWQAHDNPDRSIVLDTGTWDEVPPYPGSQPVAVTLSPEFRSTARTVDCHAWQDTTGALKNITNAATQMPLKETDLVAIVDGRGAALYTRFGITFIKESA